MSTASMPAPSLPAKELDQQLADMIEDVGPTTEEVQKLEEERDILRKALHRRNLLLDTIRRSYINDVVVVKQELAKQQNFGAEYKLDESTDKNLPSLDLRPWLRLFAPEECTFGIHHDYKSGGAVEIIHRESDKVIKMQKMVDALQKAEEKARLDSAQHQYNGQKDRTALEETLEKAKEDRETFERAIEVLRIRADAVNPKEIERQRQLIDDLTKSNHELTYDLEEAQEAAKSATQLKDKVSDLEGFVAQQTQKASEQRTELQKANNDVAARVKEIAQLTEELSQSRQTETMLDTEVQELKGDVRELKMKSHDFQERIKEMGEKEKVAKERFEETEAALQEKVDALEEELESVEDKYDRARDQAAEALQQIKKDKNKAANAEKSQAEIVQRAVADAESNFKLQLKEAQDEIQVQRKRAEVAEEKFSTSQTTMKDLRTRIESGVGVSSIPVEKAASEPVQSVTPVIPRLQVENAKSPGLREAEAKAQNALENELQVLKEQVKSLSVQLDEAQEKERILKQEVSTFEDALKDISTPVDIPEGADENAVFKAEIDSLKQRLVSEKREAAAAIASALKQSAEKVASQNLQEETAKIESLTQQLDKTKSELEKLRSTTTDESANMLAIANAKITQLERHVAALEADLARKAQQEEKLKGQIEKMKERAKGATLAGAMSKLKVPKLPVGPSKTETELETATRERDEIQKLLQAQQEAAQELKDLMEIQDFELKDSTANLQAAQQKVKEIESDRDRFETQLSEINGLMASLRTEKYELEKHVAELKKSLADAEMAAVAHVHDSVSVIPVQSGRQDATDVSNLESQIKLLTQKLEMEKSTVKTLNGQLETARAMARTKEQQMRSEIEQLSALSPTNKIPDAEEDMSSILAAAENDAKDPDPIFAEIQKNFVEFVISVHSWLKLIRTLNVSVPPRSTMDEAVVAFAQDFDFEKDACDRSKIEKVFQTSESVAALTALTNHIVGGEIESVVAEVKESNNRIKQVPKESKQDIANLRKALGNLERNSEKLRDELDSTRFEAKSNKEELTLKIAELTEEIEAANGKIVGMETNIAECEEVRMEHETLVAEYDTVTSNLAQATEEMNLLQTKLQNKASDLRMIE